MAPRGDILTGIMTKRNPSAIALPAGALGHGPCYKAGMTPDDIAKLIVRTGLRDRAAFDLVYRHTAAKLFGICLRILKDRAEAEEHLAQVDDVVT